MSRLEAVLQQAAKERLQLEKRLGASKVRVRCGHSAFISAGMLLDCAVLYWCCLLCTMSTPHKCSVKFYCLHAVPIQYRYQLR